jgi:hypothetical protein
LGDPIGQNERLIRHARMDPTQTRSKMAIGLAVEWRKAIETDRW